MSSVDVSSESAPATPPVGGEFKLEVAVVPVSDVWLLQEITTRLPGR